MPLFRPSVFLLALSAGLHVVTVAAQIVAPSDQSSGGEMPASEPAAVPEDSAAVPGPENAADRSANAEEDSAVTVEEIIVTAQRRQQSILDVPMSVSAFNADSLASSGVTDTQSLQVVTPGLVVGSAATYAQTYIRGIGNDSTTPGTESSVAVYVDGVYRSQLISGLQTFLNLDRIEVLKGPQGTLYGRNALGGAINIVTREPSRNAYEFETKATIGNYDRREASAYVSGPISEGTAFSLSAMRSKNDGYVDNLFNGQKLEADDYYALQGRVAIDLSDQTRISVSADRFNRDDTRNVAFGQLSPIPLATTIPQASDLAMAYPDGSSERALLLAVQDRPAQYSGEPWKVYNDYPSHSAIVDQGVSIKLIHSAESFEFASISSFRDLEWDGSVDIDGTNRPIFSFAANNQVGRQFTQDFQLTSVGSEDTKLHWVAGVMYVQDHSGYENFRQLFPILGVLQAGVPEVQINGQIETKAYAGYAQATYDWTDRFRTTLGGRYSWEEKELVRVDTIIPLAGLTIPTAGVPASENWSAFTPRVSVEYDVLPDVMAYVSVDRGFKSGTYNATQTSGTIKPVEPEEITALQGGFKGRFLDRRLALEAAGFYYDYKDLQTQVVDVGTGVTSLQNAASAKLYGLDLSAQAALSDRLTSSLGLALLEANYDDYVGLALTPDFVAGGNASSSRNFRDNDLPRAPKYMVNAGLNYTLPVQADTLTFSLNGNYSGSYYFDAANRVKQSAYLIVNARILYELRNGFGVSLWGKNLTDESYLMTVQTNVIGDAIQWNEPRTYGVTLQYHF